MPRYWYFAQKELLQLARDRNALALLFVMPALFILIMSLALQGGFEARRQVQVDYYFVDEAGSPGSADLMRLMDETGSFRRLPADASLEEIRARVARDEAKFLLIVAVDFDERLNMGDTAAHLEVAPGTELPLAMLFEARVRQALTSLYFEQGLGPVLEAGGLSVDAESLAALLAVESLYEGERGRQIPTSVQQGVPAWLLFAMFFVAVPLSTTLITERQNGTLARLRTMSLPAWQLMLGKMLPYLAINLCQVVVMLLVGVYLVPLFGGDQLVLGDSWGGLSLMALATSFSAVSFGLLVAQLVRTHEQATISSGVLIIIMAAIGGIMVPRFLMPETMQTLAWFSPMTWGMEGYLDLFLRGGTVVDILRECAALVSFAIVMLGLALFVSNRRGVA
jgi:ABC-2 type transport system permease protein